MKARLAIAIVGIPLLVCVGWTSIQLTRADALAEIDPAAALRIDPDHAQALMALANQQLEQKDFDAATATARHLLRVAPGQGDGFAVIALAALRQNKPDGRALLRIAVERAPRRDDVRAQAMLVALEDEDYEGVMRQVDALLRLDARHGELLYPALLQQSMLAPAIIQPLIDSLATTPPWRNAFLYTLNVEGSADLMDTIYAGLRRHGSLSKDELRSWLDRQIRDGRWDNARQHWLATLGSEPDTVDNVYNGGFEKDPTDRGFDWRKTNALGVSSNLEGASGAEGARAVHFHFMGRPAAGGDLYQPLLLPPGAYRLSLRARAEFLHSDQGLQWTVTCDKGPMIAQLDLPEGTFEWRAVDVAFKVPATGCPGQWLQLQNPAVTGSAQQVTGDLWIDDVAITAR